MIPGTNATESDEYFSDLIAVGQEQTSEDDSEEFSEDLKAQMVEEIEDAHTLDDEQEASNRFVQEGQTKPNVNGDTFPTGQATVRTDYRREVALFFSKQIDLQKRIEYMQETVNTILDLLSTPKSRGRPKGTTGIKKKVKRTVALKAAPAKKTKAKAKSVPIKKIKKKVKTKTKR